VTNPGMTRAIEVRQASGMFTFPPATEVRELFEGAVDVARSAAVPACVCAGWLMYATVLIHPFCDGNGRVARLLYLLIAGEELPAGVDWGIGEQWSARREAFTYTRPSEDTHPSRALNSEIDLGAVVAFLTRASTDGAAQMRRRVVLLEQLRDALVREAPDVPDVLAAVVIAWRRIATADVIARDLDRGYEENLERLRALVGAGLLRRVSNPPSRQDGGPARPAFAPGDRASAVVTAVVTRAAASSS